MPVRINKYLAERGVCSRRQADALIEAGKVVVDNQLATTGMKVEGTETIVVNGKVIPALKPQHVYLAFHKPIGIMTSVDPKGRDTIATYLNLKERLFPVGRLDVASSGLLILTNDGEMSEAITHPRGNHEKEYLVTVDRPIKDSDLHQMEDGMIILESMTKPAKTARVSDDTFRITLTEGRNRQIRRMCEQLNYEVRALQRTRVMNVKLGSLEPGATRPLSQKELANLKTSLGLK